MLPNNKQTKQRTKARETELVNRMEEEASMNAIRQIGIECEECTRRGHAHNNTDPNAVELAAYETGTGACLHCRPDNATFLICLSIRDILCSLHCVQSRCIQRAGGQQANSIYTNNPPAEWGVLSPSSVP